MKYESEYYGTYELTKSCKFTFYPQNNSDLSEQENLNEWMKWTDKYHPIHYFTSYMIETTRKDLPETVDTYEAKQYYPYFLYVPIAENNKDWYQNNKNNEKCEFLKASPKSRKLPITITQKRLNKWIAISKKYNVLIEIY